MENNILDTLKLQSTSDLPPHMEHLSGSIREIIFSAKEKLSIRNNEVNIAFHGQSRCGTSTIINSIRGLGDNDEGAAKISETQSISRDIQKYVMKENIILWDLPGAGTYDHPFQSYIIDKGLIAFDCIILVCE